VSLPGFSDDLLRLRHEKEQSVNLTCPGSDKEPRMINGDKGTGWCSRCPDQHVLTSSGVIPQHNRDS
jgi:hypothetical protein